MGLETFAIINDNNQVINHIVVDKEADNFEEVMAQQLAVWGCVRYVETTEEKPVIILDPDPTVWTTHTETDGFVIPEKYQPILPIEDNTPDHETVTINGKVFPADSLLIKENAHLRPEGYTIPAGAEEVSLEDKD